MPAHRKNTATVLQYLSEPWNGPLPRSLRCWSWINSGPPCSPPAMGYGAILLTTNKRSIDQAATETVSLWLLSLPCLSASPLDPSLCLPQAATASSLGISSVAQSMKAAADCFITRGFNGWPGEGYSLRRAISVIILARLLQTRIKPDKWDFFILTLAYKLLPLG